MLGCCDCGWLALTVSDGAGDDNDDAGMQPEPAHGLLGRPCLCIVPAELMLNLRKHIGQIPNCFGRIVLI